MKVNIEANHATLAGHSFHHEVAYAVANGMLGSIDANRGDPQNGWDTDQFPNSVEDLVMPMVEIVQAGGLTTGGFNFDAKLRRQSIDRTDLWRYTFREPDSLPLDGLEERIHGHFKRGLYGDVLEILAAGEMGDFATSSA